MYNLPNPSDSVKGNIINTISTSSKSKLHATDLSEVLSATHESLKKLKIDDKKYINIYIHTYTYMHTYMHTYIYIDTI